MQLDLGVGEPIISKFIHVSFELVDTIHNHAYDTIVFFHLWVLMKSVKLFSQVCNRKVYTLEPRRKQGEDKSPQEKLNWTKLREERISLKNKKG